MCDSVDDSRQGMLAWHLTFPRVILHMSDSKRLLQFTRPAQQQGRREVPEHPWRHGRVTGSKGCLAPRSEVPGTKDEVPGGKDEVPGTKE